MATQSRSKKTKKIAKKFVHDEVSQSPEEPILSPKRNLNLQDPALEKGFKASAKLEKVSRNFSPASRRRQAHTETR